MPDSLGARYERAMGISDQGEADDYLDALVVTSMRSFRWSREQAEKIERANLGYWAGYYGNETRARVERLFRCAHPVFGSIEKNGPADPADYDRVQSHALRDGMAEAARKRKHRL